MPHPKPGVAPLLAVGFWTTPILLEEHQQPMLSRSQVFLGIQGPQVGVASDATIKLRHQRLERGASAYSFVVGLGLLDGVGLLTHRFSVSSPVPASST